MDYTFIFTCKGHGKFIVSEDLVKLRLGDLGLLLKQNRNTRKILSHPIATIKLNKTFKSHHLSILELAKIVPKNRKMFIPENY